MTHDPAEKFFFLTESLKLKCFEKKLRHASKILPVSVTETGYFSNKYGNTEWLGAFHGNTGVSSSPGKGKYILLHGNLSIRENEKAVIYALKKVLRSIDFQVIVAGKNPSRQLAEKIKKNPGVILVESPPEDQLNHLIAEAHINLLISFYPSGLKLKMINALHKGRFVVANPPVVYGTGLEGIVYTGKDEDELNQLIKELLRKEPDVSMIEKRRVLLEKYSNRTNIQNLKRIMEL